MDGRKGRADCSRSVALHVRSVQRKVRAEDAAVSSSLRSISGRCSASLSILSWRGAFDLSFPPTSPGECCLQKVAYRLESGLNSTNDGPITNSGRR